MPHHFRVTGVALALLSSRALTQKVYAPDASTLQLHKGDLRSFDSDFGSVVTPPMSMTRDCRTLIFECC